MSTKSDMFGFIPVFYFCVFLEKQTFTTEITARYKLQQQNTIIYLLNTLFSSALTVIVQPIKLPATQKSSQTSLKVMNCSPVH